MAGKRPTHRLLHVADDPKRKDEQGKPLSVFTEICPMRQSENGSMWADIPRGMFLSGKLFIKPIQDKSDSAESDSVEEDLPF